MCRKGIYLPFSQKVSLLLRFIMMKQGNESTMEVASDGVFFLANEAFSHITYVNINDNDNNKDSDIHSNIIIIIIIIIIICMPWLPQQHYFVCANSFLRFAQNHLWEDAICPVLIFAPVQNSKGTFEKNSVRL